MLNVASDAKVTGLKEVLAKLDAIPANLQPKVVQRILASAAYPIVRQARNLAPRNTGTLKKSIYSRRSRKSTPGLEIRDITVKAGKSQQKFNRDAYYWKFVEFGRGTVNAKKGKVLRFFNKKTGKWISKESVAAVPARPFLRPAFEANKQKAAEIFSQKAAKIIAKAATKKG